MNDLFEVSAVLWRAGCFNNPQAAAAFVNARRLADPVAAALWDDANCRRAELLRDACAQGDLASVDRMLRDPSFDAPPVLPVPQELNVLPQHGAVRSGASSALLAASDSGAGGDGAASAGCLRMGASTLPFCSGC